MSQYTSFDNSGPGSNYQKLKELWKLLKKLSPQQIKEFPELLHKGTNTDVDRNAQAIHHTLGTRPYQAATGDHKHDLLYYKKSETYTKSEVDTLLANKSNTGHSHG